LKCFRQVTTSNCVSLCKF